MSHVPETATQIGQISKRIFLDKENNRAQNNHRDASAEAHQAVFLLLPNADFFKQYFVTGHKQYDRERQDKNEIVNQQIAHAFQISRLIVQ